MAKGRLSEKRVQATAIEWLACHYYPKLPEVKKVITYDQEVSLNHGPKQIRGRADGLLVALLLDHNILTVSLEAKSSKTSQHFIPTHSDTVFWFKAFGFSIILMLMFYAFGRAYVGSLASLLATPVIGYVGLFGYVKIKYRFPIPALGQIDRYPGNEQWLAISTDLNNQLGESKSKQLQSYCSDTGIGLLTVGEGKLVKCIERAQRRKSPRSKKHLYGFVDCYSGRKANAMKAAIKHEMAEVPLGTTNIPKQE